LTSPYITGSILPSIVGLVVVKTASRANAMTVSFFSEVAHHPTSLWVSIARTSYTHTLLEEGGQFSLIVLNQTQKEIALTCGSISGRDRDKCADLDLYPGPEGYLFLNGALASTACSVRQSLPVEDHTLFVADILQTEIESRKSYLRQLLLSDL
jgi:flavin reductase (DIM6/NTAB) family NADH-FMN oxidoreductase RutF